jgi:orotate phosphoribosyltransferase
VESAGAIVQDVVAVFEKGSIVSEIVAETGWPIRSIVRVRMEGEQVILLD